MVCRSSRERLSKRHNISGPQGVRGRNSDNTPAQGAGFGSRLCRCGRDSLLLIPGSNNSCGLLVASGKEQGSRSEHNATKIRSRGTARETLEVCDSSRTAFAPGRLVPHLFPSSPRKRTDSTHHSFPIVVASRSASDFLHNPVVKDFLRMPVVCLGRCSSSGGNSSGIPVLLLRTLLDLPFSTTYFSWRGQGCADCCVFAERPADPPRAIRVLTFLSKEQVGHPIARFLP